MCLLFTLVLTNNTSFQKEPQPVAIIEPDLMNQQVYLYVLYDDGLIRYVHSSVIKRRCRVVYDTYFNPRIPDFMRSLYADE